MKILYVEDNAANALVMRLSLKKFSVETVEDGEQAIELAHKKTFDLVLMDINLGFGKMDGCEAMKQMREIEAYAEVPFYATTAYALAGDEARFLHIGFDRYFSKPIDFGLLIECIHELSEIKE